SDVIRHFTIFDAGVSKNISHHHIKIKMAGNAQAAAMFQKGVEKVFIIQNEIARILISKQSHQAIRSAGPARQRRGDEVDVVRGELNTAIRQYDLHSERMSQKRATGPVWSRLARGEFCPRVITVFS